MDASTFAALALACAPQVHPTTAHALVSVESAFNPWAIGVVGGALRRQPNNRDEALATAHQLLRDGRNFSVGLGQINVGNFRCLGLNTSSAFDPCQNLSAIQSVLTECFDRAGPTRSRAVAEQFAIRKAFSEDHLQDIEPDGTGFIYVLGVTNQSRMPVTPNVHQTKTAGGDEAMICRFYPGLDCFDNEPNNEFINAKQITGWAPIVHSFMDTMEVL